MESPYGPRATKDHFASAQAFLLALIDMETTDGSFRLTQFLYVRTASVCGCTEESKASASTEWSRSIQLMLNGMCGIDCLSSFQRFSIAFAAFF